MTYDPRQNRRYRTRSLHLVPPPHIKNPSIAMSSSSTSSTMVLAAALGSPPSQPLTRENTLIWKALVIPALRGARVLDLVEGNKEAPKEFLETEDINKKKVTIKNPEYVSWISRDQLVLCWILNSLSPDDKGIDNRARQLSTPEAH
jgi:hypothetical protein